MRNTIETDLDLINTKTADINKQASDRLNELKAPGPWSKTERFWFALTVVPVLVTAGMLILIKLSYFLEHNERFQALMR